MCSVNHFYSKHEPETQLRKYLLTGSYSVASCVKLYTNIHLTIKDITRKHHISDHSRILLRVKLGILMIKKKTSCREACSTAPHHQNIHANNIEIRPKTQSTSYISERKGEITFRVKHFIHSKRNILNTFV